MRYVIDLTVAALILIAIIILSLAAIKWGIVYLMGASL